MFLDGRNVATEIFYIIFRAVWPDVIQAALFITSNKQNSPQHKKLYSAHKLVMTPLSDLNGVLTSVVKASSFPVCLWRGVGILQESQGKFVLIWMQTESPSSEDQRHFCCWWDIWEATWCVCWVVIIYPNTWQKKNSEEEEWVFFSGAVGEMFRLYSPFPTPALPWPFSLSEWWMKEERSLASPSLQGDRGP